LAEVQDWIIAVSGVLFPIEAMEDEDLAAFIERLRIEFGQVGL